VLLGLGGLQIGGGIASVSRSIARALDEQVAAGRIDRVDRVLLLEDPAHAAPPPRAGAQWLARGSCGMGSRASGPRPTRPVT
jgi:hypothetical protein